MSVTGVLGSSLFSAYGATSAQNKFQQIQQGFQQLGQALQSGNLSQAQSDFATLQQELPSQLLSTASGTQSGTQSTSTVSQAFSQLSQDLNSGNLTAAQSDFASLKQDISQQGGITFHGHHRTRPETSQSSNQQNSVSTLFGTLGQELQSGNLNAAQQTYSTLQQDFLQFAGSTGSSGTSGSGSSASGSALNVTA